MYSSTVPVKKILHLTDDESDITLLIHTARRGVRIENSAGHRLLVKGLSDQIIFLG